MINSYGRVLRVRDPATGEFKTIPAIRGERGPQGGPLTIAYAWDPDPTTEFTSEWQSATEDKDQQTYIGVATYYTDDELAALTKADYKWMKLPEGKIGPKGNPGEDGKPGANGLSAILMFAYAYDPDSDSAYATDWVEGMTWLGVYNGTVPPDEKSDYKWIQMPKGEQGASSVSIRYAKKPYRSSSEGIYYRRVTYRKPSVVNYRDNGKLYTRNDITIAADLVMGASTLDGKGPIYSTHIIDLETNERGLLWFRPLSHDEQTNGYVYAGIDTIAADLTDYGIYYEETIEYLEASDIPVDKKEVNKAYTTTGAWPVYTFTITDSSTGAYQTIYYVEKSTVDPEYELMYSNPTSDMSWLGIYTGDKTNPSKSDYNWFNIKGEKGEKGDTGGPVYIRYAKPYSGDDGLMNIDTNSVTEVWKPGYTWMGIAHGSFSADVIEDFGSGKNEPDRISPYTWMHLPEGIPGEKGEKGDPGTIKIMFSKYPTGYDQNGKTSMSETREEGMDYLGISKASYYSETTGQVTYPNYASGYMWMWLPSQASWDAYSASVDSLRTELNNKIQEVDSKTNVTKMNVNGVIENLGDVNDVVSYLINDLSEVKIAQDKVLINAEYMRNDVEQAVDKNIDKLNVSVGYMRTLLKRIEALETVNKDVIPEPEKLSIPLFDYTPLWAEEMPDYVDTYITFDVAGLTEINDVWVDYAISTLCSTHRFAYITINDPNHDLVNKAYLYKVSPNPDVVFDKMEIPTDGSSYVFTGQGKVHGWYVYVEFSRHLTDGIIPSELYDIIHITTENPTGSES